MKRVKSAYSIRSWPECLLKGGRALRDRPQKPNSALSVTTLKQKSTFSNTIIAPEYDCGGCDPARALFLSHHRPFRSAVRRCGSAPGAEIKEVNSKPTTVKHAESFLHSGWKEAEQRRSGNQRPLVRAGQKHCRGLRGGTRNHDGFAVYQKAHAAANSSYGSVPKENGVL